MSLVWTAVYPYVNPCVKRGEKCWPHGGSREKVIFFWESMCWNISVWINVTDIESLCSFKVRIVSTRDVFNFFTFHLASVSTNLHCLEAWTREYLKDAQINWLPISTTMDLIILSRQMWNWCALFIVHLFTSRYWPLQCDACPDAWQSRWWWC